MLLIDDRVDGDRGLAGRAVPDDQLALAAPQREQGVEHENAGIQRFGHMVAFDDARCAALDRTPLLRLDRRAAVERATERIDDPPEQIRSDRRDYDLACSTHCGACLDALGIVEQDDFDGVPLEREREAPALAFERQEFADPRARQTGHARHAIGDALDAADRIDLHGQLDLRQAALAAREPV